MTSPIRTVPVEPTEAMLDAGLLERDVSGSGPRGLPLIYKAMVAASPSPATAGDEDWHRAQEAATSRYGLQPGELQHQWRKGLRSDRSELEWAIVDALAMGCITAWPGDGVSCAAQIVTAQMDRADDALARLAATTAERDALQATLDRREARLEIDHYFRPKPGLTDEQLDGPVADTMERVEVPPSERDDQIDGISCRDETIKLIEEDCDAFVAQRDAITRKLDECPPDTLFSVEAVRALLTAPKEGG